MDVINIGSLNLDWVYQVPHFVQPGETLTAISTHEYLGGKGLNQSIALARAGSQVAHVGAIGHDGNILRDALNAEGINVDFVSTLDGPSGHAIIQVTPEGENAIVIFPGTNQQLNLDQIKQALAQFPQAQAVLLQNETNLLPDIMKLAKQAGKFVFYNPAPMLPEVKNFPLEHVDVLILNQMEAHALSGNIHERWPHLIIVLTQGSEGVTVATREVSMHYSAVPVDRVVDTTAAGDTFIGYFITEYLQTGDISSSAKLATHAASLCIQSPGAMQSIPKRGMMAEV